MAITDRPSLTQHLVNAVGEVQQEGFQGGAEQQLGVVDEDQRHTDLPSLEAQIEAEKRELENRRDADVETRTQKLEKDIAELEAEGAKSDAKRKVRDSAEREMNQIRKRADTQVERLEQVWDRFKNLKVQDLEGDEILYREMRDRFGMYFEGGMGAAALQKRLETFDLDAEQTRQVSPVARALLALYCFKRVHLKSIALVLADTCSKDDLIVHGGDFGADLYERARRAPQVVEERPKITLSKGALMKVVVDQDLI